MAGFFVRLVVIDGGPKKFRIAEKSTGEDRHPVTRDGPEHERHGPDVVRLCNVKAGIGEHEVKSSGGHSGRQGYWFGAGPPAFGSGRFKALSNAR